MYDAVRDRSIPVRERNGKWAGISRRSANRSRWKHGARTRLGTSQFERPIARESATELARLDLGNEQSERQIQNARDVARGELVAEQRLGMTQALVHLAGGGELHAVEVVRQGVGAVRRDATDRARGEAHGVVRG